MPKGMGYNLETKSVRKASYSGLDRKGGNAAASIEGVISKMGNGTGCHNQSRNE